MAARLGVAVVGAGLYGRVHARVYAADPRVRLVRVWSRTEERARPLADQHGCDWTTDLKRVADDERIQVVSVATPDFAHVEPAVALLNAGKHVLLEKPMATSVADAQRILRAHRRSGRKFMVNFHNRWYPSFVHAKRLLEAGELGDPVLAYARLSDRVDVPTEWLSWSAQSGPHWFLLPHVVDLLRWFFDEDVRRVHALATNGVLRARGFDTFDAVQAQLCFDHAVATVESSWVLPRAWRSIIDFKIDILGSKGRLALEADREGIEVTTDSRCDAPLVLDPTTTEVLPIRHFVDCVLEDRTPACTAEDGLAATAVIEAAVKSIDEKRPVDVR